MIYEKFRNGINLGGWFSQYDVNEPEPFTEEERSNHFRNFIVESDIKRIREWGFDHVRLPIDGKVFFDTETGSLSEEIKSGIERCLDWCSQYQLNVILDLHDMEGNVYGAMDKPMPLLREKKRREAFVYFWREMTRWLKNRETPAICFELFNEISDATGYLWRSLYKEAVKAIRKIDKKRLILIGSNNQNSIGFLKELDLLDDKCVFYNFHYYDPQVFTHQRAHFSEEFRLFNKVVTYPGDISEFRRFLNENPQWKSKHRLTAEEDKCDKDLMIKLLKEAEEFVLYSGFELYCGEYGVIDTAPPKEAAKWIRDFNELAEEYRFGRCLWNYKTLDFGLVNKENEVVHKELVEKIAEWNLKYQ